MKKLLTATTLVLALAACTDTKKEEKELLQQVIDVHEKVMEHDDKAINVRMKLDTLIAKADSLKLDKIQGDKLREAVIKADADMSHWMKDFNADLSGKQHDDVMAYLNGQLREVKRIDSLLVLATSAAQGFVKKTK
jgi:hypothetical protein